MTLQCQGDHATRYAYRKRGGEEDRDSYSRGARIQLDGSTDVNGERERERDTMARPLHSSSLSYLSPEPVRSSLVGNGRGVRGRGRPRRRRVKSTPRGEGEGPGDRSLSAVASHPLPPAYIFLSGNAPPHHLHTLELRDCTRK